MNEVYTLTVQRFGKRCVFAHCNHDNQWLCTVPHDYVTGRKPPNYPMPAIRYNVVNYASGDCIEIRSWKTGNKPLIDKVYWKPV